MRTDMNQTFEKIYGSESDAIFRYCLVRVSDREQAIDITQEAFLRLWQSLQKGEDIKNNRAFLFTITHRLIIDWYRKKKSFSLESLMSQDEGNEHDVVDDKTSGDQILSGAEGRYLVEKMNELHPSHRDPVYLRYVEDLSPPEIGEILGISANAASVRINRGLEELKQKYNG